MYPYHRPNFGNSRPPPPLPQTHRPPPRNPYPQQDSYFEDDEEWSDCSDDGQVEPPYTTASFPQRPDAQRRASTLGRPGHTNYQPSYTKCTPKEQREQRQPWGNPQPHQPLPARPGRSFQDVRPPPVPRKDAVLPDHQDMYLQFDPELESTEIGNGVKIDRPPPHTPHTPHTPHMGGRPPMAPPMPFPGRPPKPNEPQDVYMTESVMPPRPPPQPPVKSPNPSPKSSFKNLRREHQASTDSGFAEAISRNNSGNSHRPARTGSNESWSSGDNESETGSTKSAGFPKITGGSSFGTKFRNKSLPPMPPMPQQPPSTSAPQKQPVPSSPLASASASAVKELTNLLASRPTGFNAPRKDFPFSPMPATEGSPTRRQPPSPFSPTKSSPEVPTPTRRKSNVPLPSRGSKVVEEQSWYANVSRVVAEQRLVQANREGCFLVRLGRGDDNPYTITAYGNNKCYNLRIRKRDEDDKYALGSKKPNERAFPTVCDIIEYYTSSPLQLAQGEGSVTLCGAP